MLELKISYLTFNVEMQSHMLMLYAEDADLYLPIVIGASEAHLIAIEKEEAKPPRPLMHDILCNLIDDMGYHLDSIQILRMEAGIFYADLVFYAPDGRKVVLDSRPSDAIILSLRLNAPIYTTDDIIDRVGISADDIELHNENGERINPDRKQSYDTMSNSELQKLLDLAIDREDYEEASRIRDELNNRKL